MAPTLFWEQSIMYEANISISGPEYDAATWHPKHFSVRITTHHKKSCFPDFIPLLVIDLSAYMRWLHQVYGHSQMAVDAFLEM